MSYKQLALLEPTLVRQALLDAVKKLSPMAQWRNPVTFIVWVSNLLTTLLAIAMANSALTGSVTFTAAVSIWLRFTALLANFAEAMVESRSRARVNSLKGVKKTTFARKLCAPQHDATVDHVPAENLCEGDVALVEAGDIIPCDGEVIRGGASVDESVVTGESTPVIHESSGDFVSVTGRIRILFDWLVVRCNVNSGRAFLDRTIAMMEDTRRCKAPNRIALTILLIAPTLVFLLVTATIWPFSACGSSAVSVTVLVALLVCPILTAIDRLLSVIDVAGMSHMPGANMIAINGRTMETAGDVDIPLLDKTGTITLGNRQTSVFLPTRDMGERTLADTAQLSSLTDETLEGCSVVVLTKQCFSLHKYDLQSLRAIFVFFTVQTWMSGINIDQRIIREGLMDAICRHVEVNGGHFPTDVNKQVKRAARQGTTPLVVAEGERVLEIISLKDIVKNGIRERFAQLRKTGIKTVMITGGNRLTVVAITTEARVDNFLAEAIPEAKLALVHQYQSEGWLVAMTGSGIDDAPTPAQANVAVTINSDTQVTKEADNMVDLDSNSTKLIEMVRIDKQMLITCGSLTTFSIANNVVKYFAIIPAASAAVYPQLAILNVMGLYSPSLAILNAVIFNALIIVFLILLVLKGMNYRPLSASAVLCRNLWVYGLDGLLVSLIGIRAIDPLLTPSGPA